MNRKLPPIYKVCVECGTKYTCDRRWGKAKRERSKTCSVKCQRAWLGKLKIGVAHPIKPRKRNKDIVTFEEFKAKIKRRTLHPNQYLPNL